MQLRVARLCLDCEELHTEKHCPRCASEHYALVTNWLPSEERRRWRRPPQPSVAREGGVEAVMAAIVRWFRGESSLPEPTAPATRRGDFVVDLDFDERDRHAPQSAVVEPQLSKHERH